jgi:hypothetical protein
LIGELGYWNGAPEVDANGKKKNKSRERYYNSRTEKNRKWLMRWIGRRSNMMRGIHPIN